MNLIPQQIYVAFKPSIKLTGTTQTMSQVKNAFAQQSNGSVSIGAFCWNASAAFGQGSQNSAADLKWSTDNTSVTITDNTNAPKVIGIVPKNQKP